MAKKKPKRSIDWTAVERAMRRGKMGRMHPGDLELCEQAFRADRQEYRKRKMAIDDQVIAETRLQHLQPSQKKK